MVMISYKHKKCLINVLIVIIRLNIHVYPHTLNHYKLQLVL